MQDVNKLAVIGSARSLGTSIIWPFIGFALLAVYHFSLEFVSLFYLLQGIVSVLAYIVSGFFTDFFGRVKTMIMFSVSASISMFLAFLFPNPLFVALGVLAQSFFNSGYYVANTSIVGDLKKNDISSLIRAFSRLRVGINLGWALGPTLGGYVFSILGFRPLLLLSSLVSIFPIFLLRSLPDVKTKIELSLHVSKEFLQFLLPTFFTFMLMGQLGFSYLTYYVSVVKFTTFQVGILFMINGLLIATLQEIVGRKIRPFDIVYGMVIYSISYFSISLVSNFVEASLDMVFITLAEMIVAPLSQALASSFSDDKSRGRTIGIYGMATSLGRVSGSSISALLMASFLYRPMELWGAISTFGIISSIIYLLMFYHRKF
ncbi:MFS transporter [Sulfuracidifex metallicus]|uniref:MFS transporter n=1 Tax=Sulfuracidifex metallicus TaxID=47303 RepID=UPI002273E0C7|nr:MFS transporter [Sulfuracidifex metallicus]MCY0849362.1 MFS transporter [Sulfuracidifex metallicus]